MLEPLPGDVPISRTRPDVRYGARFGDRRAQTAWNALVCRSMSDNRRVMRVRILVVGVALVAVSCGAGNAASEQGTPSTSGTTAAPTTSRQSSTTIADSLCGNPIPERLDPFPYNRDHEARDELVGLDVRWGVDDVGGTISIEVDAATVEDLLEAGFLDPYMSQNLGASAWEIFQFMCDHPASFAMGYVVSPDREDYRVTIDGIFANGPVDADRLRELCKDAEEAEVRPGEGGGCWWD